MSKVKQTIELENGISRRRFLTLAVQASWLAAMGALTYQIGRFLDR